VATCLDIITDAMRERGVLGLGKDPKAAEAEHGLKRLQAIFDGLMGNGIGASLSDLAVTASGTLVADTKALVSATAALTLTFPATPSNGQRIQVIDLLGNFGSCNVTLAGNGSRIETAASVSLFTNSINRTWIYIDGNWTRIEALSLSDTIILDDDEFFTLELAKRLSGFGAPMAAESVDALRLAKNRIRARYSYPVVTPADDAVRFLSRQAYRSALDQPPA
jgi:hypothetical protein